jgi:hypothetical protein
MGQLAHFASTQHLSRLQAQVAQDLGAQGRAAGAAHRSLGVQGGRKRGRGGFGGAAVGVLGPDRRPAACGREGPGPGPEGEQGRPGGASCGQRRGGVRGPHGAAA